VTAILHRLALGLGVAAFIVVALSSSLAGAAPTSVVTRGVVAFVVFGLFGLVALRGVVYGVIRELAEQAEAKRRDELEQQQQQTPKQDESSDIPLPE
jgi:hypothetical protein